MAAAQFNRKAAFMARLGLRHSKFHAEMAAGRVPPPDAWLGPRSPVWTEATVEKTIASYVATTAKPAELPAQLRRKEAE